MLHPAYGFRCGIREQSGAEGYSSGDIQLKLPRYQPRIQNSVVVTLRSLFLSNLSAPPASHARHKVRASLLSAVGRCIVLDRHGLEAGGRTRASRRR